MDLAKRILNVVQSDGGIAVYVALPKPNPLTGFIVLYNSSSTVASDPNIIIKFREFMVEFITTGSGIAAFRRSGRVVWGNFQYFDNQPDAENYALANKISYIYNVGTNTSINLGSLDPQFPGDGIND